jgi:transcriptional regulator with XRE-family HTH domain
MNKFITNFKSYIKHYKLKQNIIAMKIGYDKNKLSRILNNKNKLTLEDMNSLAAAVGKNVSYFTEDFSINKSLSNEITQIAFNIDNPSKEKEAYANKLFDLLENIDIIMGMESKISHSLKEVL